jgi:hypothetical protein
MPMFVSVPNQAMETSRMGGSRQMCALLAQLGYGYRKRERASKWYHDRKWTLLQQQLTLILERFLVGGDLADLVVTLYDSQGKPQLVVIRLTLVVADLPQVTVIRPSV